MWRKALTTIQRPTKAEWAQLNSKIIKGNNCEPRVKKKREGGRRGRRDKNKGKLRKKKEKKHCCQQ